MGIPSVWLDWGRRSLVVLLTGLLIVCSGCAKPTEPTQLMAQPSSDPNPLAHSLMEVSPPEVIQTLGRLSNTYTPQVRILSPRPEEVVETTEVSVRFQVRGLPIYKEEQRQLGPHLHVFLDDQPYRAVYDLSEPLVLKDLGPGTHTLRVFASRPWHESFKNEGAFDQRTFHVFTQTPQRGLPGNAPLLTYSRPQGAYGAEPIMLDFYLTNAPLHAIAQADSRDDVPDWRIRCTVNGDSFVFDQWQPIYLKGFKPGQNWVQLELIDEAGEVIPSPFNNTVRVIEYQPGGDDTLSQLVRGELTAQQVAQIIDPDYEPPAQPAPEPEPTPAAAPEKSSAEAPTPAETAEPPAATTGAAEAVEEKEEEEDIDKKASAAEDISPEPPAPEPAAPERLAEPEPVEAPEDAIAPEPEMPEAPPAEPEPKPEPKSEAVEPALEAADAEEDPAEPQEPATEPSETTQPKAPAPEASAEESKPRSKPEVKQPVPAPESSTRPRNRRFRRNRDELPSVTPEPLETAPGEEDSQPLPPIPEIMEPYEPEPDLQVPVNPEAEGDRVGADQLLP